MSGGDMGMERGSRPLQEWRFARAVRLRAWWPPALAAIGVVGFWEIFVPITGEPAYVLPPLHSIVATAIQEAPEVFFPAAWITLREVLGGLLLGASAGLVLGTLVATNRIIRAAVLPMVIMSQSVPVIAMAPILIIWFGFGILPKILVAALVCFFPVAINTIAGLNATEEETLRLMRSLNASPSQVFAKVRLPMALPFVFAGLKQSAVLSVIGAIVGEWVGASEGLGPVMIAANASFNTKVV